MDFLIDNKSALSLGIRMGSSFLDNLEAPADQKDYITNSVRTEHGDRVIPVRSKLASRTVTLEFVIIGKANSGKTAHEAYEERLDAFYEILHNGFVTISVPDSRNDVYRLWAQMKSSTYAKGKGDGGAIGKISVKFMEPNPGDRGAIDSSDLALFNVPEYEDYSV